MYDIYFEKINKTVTSIDFIFEILKNYYDFKGKKHDIIKTKNGKPYIKGYGLHFSISNKNDFIAVIVADNPVGIDIEVLKGKDRDNIAKKVLVQEEFLKYENLESKLEKEKKFLEFWTKKEAIIKKNGWKLSDIFSLDTKNYNCFTLFLKNYVLSVCL